MSKQFAIQVLCYPLGLNESEAAGAAPQTRKYFTSVVVVIVTTIPSVLHVCACMIPLGTLNCPFRYFQASIAVLHSAFPCCSCRSLISVPALLPDHLLFFPAQEPIFTLRSYKRFKACVPRHGSCMARGLV